MKKWILNICSLLIVGIYLISSMGYGIHECTTSGSKDVILLFGETPCEYVHSNSSSKECNCLACNDLQRAECDCCSGCGQHGDNCCTTVTYVLSQEQINSQQVNIDSMANDAMALVAYCNLFAESYSTIFPNAVVEYTTGFKNITEPSLQIVAASQIRI